MKKTILICFFFVTLNAKLPIIKVVYGGRFGDNLTCIYKGLCLSIQHHIDLIFPAFKYSNLLKINNLISENDTLKNVIEIEDFSKIKKLETDIVYGVTLLSKIDFNNDVYMKAIKKLRQLILPNYKINMSHIKMHKNCINVAVHVRQGGGYDMPLLSKDEPLEKISMKDAKDAIKIAIAYENKPCKYSDVKWPLKFPPHSYYIKQIKNLFNMINKKRMHIHIFTDSKNPEFISSKYKKEINEPLISYSSHPNNYNYSTSTVDDFFAMTKFDCLIRSDSSFSINAERWGNFKIVIYPEHAIWVEKDKLIIDKVGVLKNGAINKFVEINCNGL